MPSRYSHTRSVEFAETDLAGIVHFSNFFRYMESCEHAFFRSLGFSIHPTQAEADLHVGWPRVHASADYRAPLHFEETFTVALIVSEKKARSLTYTFRFHRGDSTAGEVFATGVITAVCVRRDPDSGRYRACPIPEPIAAVIDADPDPAA